MVASGNPYDGPKACPFVALESDRDRRSERPDYRHRCYAEPAPAPRSIAHQEAYCLSPSFAACPIFQDWALRAAARPAGAPDAASAAAAGAAAVAAAPFVPPDAPEPPIEDELSPLGAMDGGPGPESEPVQRYEPESDAPIEPEPKAEPEPAFPAATDSATGRDAAYEWDVADDAQQLSAFDDPAVQASLPGAFTAPESEPGQPWDVPEAPAEQAGTAAYVPPPARRDAPPELEPEDAAVPAFLAGRAAQQPPPTSLPPPKPSDRVSREEIVPSWEIDGRYGADPVDDDDRAGSRFDAFLTAVAVIVILGLGVAGVLFLPGLLAGTPSRSPAPTIAVTSPGPTELSTTAPATDEPTSAPQTAAPTEAPPTANASPEASPRLYRIKTGDTLARIARRFDITVQELLAANPQIEDPNRILVGFVLVIPPPSIE